MDLKELEIGIEPNKHWYYQTRQVPLFRYFEQVLKKFPSGSKIDIIDVGAGSGFFLLALYRKYTPYIAQIYLVDTGYTPDEVRHSKNSSIKKVTTIPEGIENSFVLMMDVLEHIENDKAFLQEIRSKVTGTTYFFVTVPAFMSLWSGHDVFLGHYRRYTCQTLHSTLRESGFAIWNVYYFFGSIFPIVFFIRKFRRRQAQAPKSDMQPVPPPINTFLKLLLKPEIPFRRLNQFFGVSWCGRGGDFL